MVKCTLNLTPRLIRTKYLNFEGDKLTVVDCMGMIMIAVCATFRSLFIHVNNNEFTGMLNTTCVVRSNSEVHFIFVS